MQNWSWSSTEEPPAEDEWEVMKHFLSRKEKEEKGAFYLLVSMGAVRLALLRQHAGVTNGCEPLPQHCNRKKPEQSIYMKLEEKFPFQPAGDKLQALQWTETLCNGGCN